MASSDSTIEPVAESPLRDSERQFQLLARNATNFAIFLITPEGRIDSWNEGARRVLLYDEAEILGQPAAIIFTAEDRAGGVPERELATALRDGRASDVRWHQRKDGTRFWADGVMERLTSPTGVLEGFAKTLRDATDDKRAETREQNHLAQIFEQAPALMATLRGPQHVFEMTNPPYDALIGNRDVLGKPVAVAMPELVEQGFVALLDQVYQTGVAYVAKDVDVLVRRSPGGPMEEVTVDFTYQPLFDRDGRVTGILSHGIDRTRRKQQERQSQVVSDALDIAEERLRLATTSARIGTWDFDPVKDELFWDARCRAAFGYPLDRPIDYVTNISLIHPDDRERTDRAVQDALAPSGTGEYSVEFRTIGFQDGVERWVRVDGKALFDASHTQALRFVGTIQDVTEAKRVEKELAEARQRLEAALSAGNIATWTFDVRHNRVVADSNLARLFSVDPEEAAGGELGVYLAAILEEDRPRVIETINRAIESGSHYGAEYRVALPDGSHRSLAARGTVERDAQGRALALPGVVVDITERIEQDRRKRFFTDLVVNTRGLLDPEAILYQTARAVGEYANADRALFAEIDDDADKMTIRRDFVQAHAAVPSRTGVFILSAFGMPLVESLRAGVVTQVFDTEEDSRLTPDSRAAFRAARLRAFLAVPVHRSGRLVAILALQQAQPRVWTPEEAELLGAAIERTWLAVENAAKKQTSSRPLTGRR